MTQVTIDMAAVQLFHHKIGNWYSHPEHGLCVLAFDGDNVGLFFTDGKPFTEMVPVLNFESIFGLSAEEFDLICAGSSDDFTPIAKITISASF